MHSGNPPLIALAPTHAQMLPSSRPVVRKKAALCLLRLLRKSPAACDHQRLPLQLAQLLDDRDLGQLVALMPLLLELVQVGASPASRCS